MFVAENKKIARKSRNSAVRFIKFKANVTWFCIYDYITLYNIQIYFLLSLKLF